MGLRARRAQSEQVLRRLGALSLRLHRHHLETIRPRPNPPDLGARWRADWKAAPSVYKDALTHIERKWFALPVGGWKENEIINNSWALEEAAVLRYARGEYDLGLYDRTISSDDEVLSGDDWAGELELRPLVSDIERTFNEAELLRSMTRRKYVGGGPLKGLGGRAFTSMADVEAAKAEYKARRRMLRPPKKSELRRLAAIQAADPILSTSFEELTDDDLDRVRSIAIERSKACRWLLGFCVGDRDLFPDKAKPELDFFAELSPADAAIDSFFVEAEGRRRYHSNALDRVLLGLGFQPLAETYELYFGDSFTLCATPVRSTSVHVTFREASGQERLATAAARRVCERLVKATHGSIRSDR